MKHELKWLNLMNDLCQAQSLPWLTEGHWGAQSSPLKRSCHRLSWMESYVRQNFDGIIQSNLSKCANHVITREALKGLLLPEDDVQVLLLLHLFMSEGQNQVAMVTGSAVEVQMFLRPSDKKKCFNLERIHC